jgi:hypothetical protein
MPFVIIVKKTLGLGEEKFETIDLPGTTLRIGRGTNSDLHLDDHSVQLHHAIIQEENDRYVLRDLNALSFTSVNDVMVQEVVLPEAGTIRIGPYLLRFARPTPASPFTIEYEVLADIVRTAELAASALEAESLTVSPEASATAPGTPVAPGTLGEAAATTLGAPAQIVATHAPGAPGGLPSRPASARRDEKVHLVAGLLLGGRYINKSTITVLAVLVVLGGSALVFALGKHWVFMPGSVSMKHRLFANDCARCHAAWNPILTVVPDKTCLSCHSGPPHFSARALSPAPQCASCHVEHRGQAALAAVFESTCTQCHADLKVKEARVPVETHIHSFMVDHPEFAVAVSRPGHPAAKRVRLNDKAQVVDAAAIKLNHHVHLKPELIGPDGPEQLSCASCHRADPQGAYMRPVSYEKDCMRCHLLDFDGRLPGKTVPHGQSLAAVDRFLSATYTAYYFREHPAERKASASVKQLPLPRPQEKPLIDGMVEEAERQLIGNPGVKMKNGKCVLCHMLDYPRKASPSAPVGGTPSILQVAVSRMPFPAVVKTAIPQQWLPYSIFDHQAHNILQCVACHEAAPRSERTMDVLLPSITSCRKCHFEPSGARAQCLTCHVYHDKTQAQKPGVQPYSIEQFQQGQASPLAVPATRSSP